MAYTSDRRQINPLIFIIIIITTGVVNTAAHNQMLTSPGIAKFWHFAKHTVRTFQSASPIRLRFFVCLSYLICWCCLNSLTIGSRLIRTMWGAPRILIVDFIWFIAHNAQPQKQTDNRCGEMKQIGFRLKWATQWNDEWIACEASTCVQNQRLRGQRADLIKTESVQVHV